METGCVQQNRQCIQAAIAAVVAILEQLSIALFMSTSKPENAIWNDVETQSLINYLIEHKSEAGDGVKFKDPTFTGAAEAILPLRTKEPPKTGKMCKTKFASVSKLYLPQNLIDFNPLSLKPVST